MHIVCDCILHGVPYLHSLYAVSGWHICTIALKYETINTISSRNDTKSLLCTRDKQWIGEQTMLLCYVYSCTRARTLCNTVHVHTYTLQRRPTLFLRYKVSKFLNRTEEYKNKNSTTKNYVKLRKYKHRYRDTRNKKIEMAKIK